MNLFSRPSKDAGSVIPEDPGERHDYALKLYGSAQRLFHDKKFRAARKIISLYRKCIDYERLTKYDTRTADPVILSVVVVSYNAGNVLAECLASLDAQEERRFETIVVDNGNNEGAKEDLLKKHILHIACPVNFGLSEGRNIGAHFARGGVIAFLDDDAIAAPGYIRNIRSAFATYDILGFRGKVLPKTATIDHSKIRHYDLGDRVIPADINAECNCGFLRDAYIDMGGMDPLLFGHEGSELSYRIHEKYGEYTLAYLPEIVVYHDHSIVNPDKQKAKDVRHALMNEYLKKKFPRIKKYRKRIKNIEGDRLIKLKGM
ncbi:MAG: glycosyltransferase [Chitinispirillaceae bacterium]|nr:glycosyltransferase [Chitinispirillaceae bacterium]